MMTDELSNQLGGVGRNRAIVIGGGILGVSTLYHLAQNGWQNSVLIEKTGLTSGSTWHASGDLGFSLVDPLHSWFVRYSAQLYQSLYERTESHLAWNHTGGLRLAYNAHEERYFEHYMDISRDMGVPIEVMTPDRAARIHPLFDFQGVLSCLHSPLDSHVDPSSVTMLLAAEARREGARIIERDRVIGIDQQGGSHWSIHTRAGELFEADNVILACGCYTPQVGRWFGLQLPVYSFLHHYFITETIPELEDLKTPLPIVRDEDCGGYVRQEMNGLLIGTSENTLPKRIWEEGIPWDEEASLFNVDYESVEHLLTAATRRFPILERTGVKKAIRGAVTYTPDGRMLLGPTDAHPGLWVAAGASSGVAWAGGIGKCIADLVAFGRAPVSVEMLSPNRFDGKAENWLLEAATQVFLNRGKTRIYTQSAPPQVHSDAPIS